MLGFRRALGDGGARPETSASGDSWPWLRFLDGLSGCPGEGIKPYHPVAEVRRADASVVVELLLLAVRVGHGRVVALAAWVGLTLR